MWKRREGKTNREEVLIYHEALGALRCVVD